MQQQAFVCRGCVEAYRQLDRLREEARRRACRPAAASILDARARAKKASDSESFQPGIASLKSDLAGALREADARCGALSSEAGVPFRSKLRCRWCSCPSARCPGTQGRHNVCSYQPMWVTDISAAKTSPPEHPKGTPRDKGTRESRHFTNHPLTPTPHTPPPRRPAA